MWAESSVFYQIYPLGFCGAPLENDGSTVNRIAKVIGWIDQIKRVGANAVYFSPVFESDRHGYDTRDYRKIDCRLGSNQEFKTVCEALHQEGIRVVIDGVFNHVGRGFWAFQDVLKNRENSPYRDWFHLNFQGDSNYHDGLWYEGWEGHYDLVKLNLQNEEVIRHLFACVKGWIEEFDIDGIRLDVAYCLDKNFLRRLRQFTDEQKQDFFLVGELLHGDYNQFVNDGMLHSCTNYECYKGLYSSFNCMNMFEICHSLLRQFGPENWTIYKGKHLLCFVDNHDVSRVSSILQNENHLHGIYAMLFGMPGIPCVYYGSEWAQKGDKKDGDPGLRPFFDRPVDHELTDWIGKLARIHKEHPALWNGGFKTLVLTNRQCVFERQCNEEKVIIAVNAEDKPYTAHFECGCGEAIELISGLVENVAGGVELPAYGVKYWKIY